MSRPPNSETLKYVRKVHIVDLPPSPSLPLSAVDHYHKTSSQYIAGAKLTNELQVSSSGKPHDLATRALHILRVK